MNGDTHDFGGLAIGLAAVYVLQPPLPDALCGVGLAVIASSLPDAFQPRIPFIKVPLVEGHRAISHWLLAAAGLAWLVNLAWGEMMAIFFFAGYVSHLILDIPTGGGIPILGPISSRIGTYWIKNGRLSDVDTWLSQILEIVK